MLSTTSGGQRAGAKGIDLSIIIVNWNTADFLRDCLDSLHRHPCQAAFEMIIVDNASTDDSLAMVERYFPTATVISNRTNQGFARANNQAIRLSRGRYVLLLNPDTILLPGAIDTMIRFLNHYPEVAVVGPQIIGPDGEVAESYSTFPGPGMVARGLWKALTTSYVAHKKTPSLEASQVDWVGGACMMVRRRALEEVGLFDEAFFMYWEEADLCWRLAQHRWRTYYLPWAQVVHYGGGASDHAINKIVLNGLLLDEWSRSGERFLRKHYPAWVPSTVKALMVSQIALSTLFWLFLYTVWPPKRKQARGIVRAYWQLLTFVRRGDKFPGAV